jgi:hypothetical protein
LGYTPTISLFDANSNFPTFCS